MFVLWLCFVHAPDLFVAQQQNRGAAGWQGCEREAGLRWTVMQVEQEEIVHMALVWSLAKCRLKRCNSLLAAPDLRREEVRCG